MTKKDYATIARALSKFYLDDDRPPLHTASATMEYVVVRIADALEADNPRFDRTKFYQACGVTE
jgi:hypothetical protein